MCFQAQQLLAQGYDLSPYRSAPGAALAASAPRLTAPSAPTYASNFDTFSSGAGAAAAPLVAASPLSRQAASLFGADPSSQLITHHPGHGANGATSFSSSSFTNTVQWGAAPRWWEQVTLNEEDFASWHRHFQTSSPSYYIIRWSPYAP